MAISLEKKNKVNLRKRVNLEKSGLGKYAGVHGVIRKNEVAAARPSVGVAGKGVGKSLNYPMDSDQEFEKRMKRYQREQRAAEDAAHHAAAVVSSSPLEAVSA